MPGHWNLERRHHDGGSSLRRLRLHCDNHPLPDRHYALRNLRHRSVRHVRWRFMAYGVYDAIATSLYVPIFTALVAIYVRSAEIALTLAIILAGFTFFSYILGPPIHRQNE